MRLPNTAHQAHPWRIQEIVPDFTLEDVWALPALGGRDDFEALVEMTFSLDPARVESLPTRALWTLRDRVGGALGLGRITAPAAGDDRDPHSLLRRLPEDLRGTASGVRFRSLPFVPLYRTDVEAAAEVSNRTVHGVAHLAWVDRGDGRYQGQMAVYVKPRGLFGKAYMDLIKPFRYWIVYPALMRQFEREWAAQVSPSRGRR